MEPAKYREIQTLQVLRGLAACAVAFYHVHVIMMQPEYGSVVLFRYPAKYGFLGVCFFFVLSGFIILMAHYRDIGDRSAIGTYVQKRFIRVFPVYWIYLTAFIAAAAIGIGYPDFSWNPANLLVSYTLIPFIDKYTLPLKVAWTLVYEVRFYLIFLLLIIWGARALWIFAAWFVIIVISSITGLAKEIDVFSVWNLYFLAGMAGFAGFRVIPPRWGRLILTSGIGLLILFVLLSDDIDRIGDLSDREYLHYLLVPCFTLIIVGASLVELDKGLEYLPVFRLLGDASYSIYLVHSAIISVVAIISTKYRIITLIGPVPFFLICFGLAVFGGVIAYLIIEKPALYRLKISLLQLKKA